jgi:pimeloyl-ACP methyl ester carboxylesterase
MKYPIRDTAIHYEIRGSGTPILMIHGWGPDHRLMKGCMEPLFRGKDAEWRRIYFDLPGMGQTEGRPWIGGSEGMLDVIAEFADGILPEEHFLLAGESYGGYLARGLVRRWTQRIDGLLLICPSIRPWIATENGLDKGDVPDPVVLEKDDLLLAELTAEQRASFGPPNTILNRRVWKRFSEEILPGLAAADPDFLENVLGRNAHFPYPVDEIEEPYNRPVLILTGRQDASVGYRGQFKLADGYPRASYAVLDRAAHNLPIENPVLFDALVSDWLERVVRERKSSGGTP